MKNPKGRLLIVLCLILFALFASGCTRTYFTGFDPQSHFEYPNSNVIPLGKVVGEASRSAFLSPVFVDSDLVEEAVQNALSQKPEADILINFMTFNKTSSFFGVNTLTLRVEGTAAKMEIGTQKLY